MGRPQRLTVEQLPPSTEVSRDPIHPKSRSCWPGICSDKVPFAGSVWSGEVGYVGLQVAAALEMTGGQGNTHTPLSALLAGLQPPALENRSLEIRKYIASQ